MIFKMTRPLEEFIINTEFITYTHLRINGEAFIYVIGKNEPIKIPQHEFRELEKELIKQNHKFLNETR